MLCSFSSENIPELTYILGSRDKTVKDKKLFNPTRLNYAFFCYSSCCEKYCLSQEYRKPSLLAELIKNKMSFLLSTYDFPSYADIFSL